MSEYINSTFDRQLGAQKNEIPQFLLKLLSIPNKSGNIFSLKYRSSLENFILGKGNSSQQSNGLGVSLESIKKIIRLFTYYLIQDCLLEQDILFLDIKILFHFWMIKVSMGFLCLVKNNGHF